MNPITRDIERGHIHELIRLLIILEKACRSRSRTKLELDRQDENPEYPSYGPWIGYWFTHGTRKPRWSVGVYADDLTSLILTDENKVPNGEPRPETRLDFINDVITLPNSGEQIDHIADWLKRELARMSGKTE